MTDKKDSGIGRRKVLRMLGTTGIVGSGIAASSQPVAARYKPRDPNESWTDEGGGPAYIPSSPDYYATHNNVVPISDPSQIGKYSEYVGFDTVIPGDSGYAVKLPTDDGGKDSQLAWEHSTEGPSSGDTVVVWAHGWQDGGVSIFNIDDLEFGSGGSAEDAVLNGIGQCDFAWDAIKDGADDEFLNSIDHEVGWAWNSRSASANFQGAVGQAHRIGPKNYSTFLIDLAERIAPGGTLHLGAHSLGCWMTLEALGEVYMREYTSGAVGEVLDTVRFVCGAVPSSAVRGDAGWTDTEGHWSSDPYSPTYDRNALRLPNKVINGYYPCDRVLSTNCCDEGPDLLGGFLGGPIGFVIDNKDSLKCGAFRTYMKNYDSGSSSIAIGTDQNGGQCPPPVDLRSGAAEWENRRMSEVELHTGSYKHPDAEKLETIEGPTGGGQTVIWPGGSRGASPCGGGGSGGGGGDEGDEDDEGDGGDEIFRTA